MGSYKLFILLFSIVVYVNYDNYFSYDIQKLSSKNTLLESKIAFEKELSSNSASLKSFEKYKKTMFDGKKLSYSQAMGKMQELITHSAKDLCTLNTINWAQVAIKRDWYEKLRMNISLSCSPTALSLFSNKLQDDEKIFYFENFAALKNEKDDNLDIGFQLSSFRSFDEL